MTLQPADDSSGLRALGAAWRESVEITEAYRAAVRTAVLEAIAGGMSPAEIHQRCGISRVTIDVWLTGICGNETRSAPPSRGSAAARAFVGIVATRRVADGANDQRRGRENHRRRSTAYAGRILFGSRRCGEGMSSQPG